MKKNLKKIFKFIILILILILLFLILRSTYSKYITQEDSGLDTHVDNWNIKITTDDVNGSHSFSGDIQMIRNSSEYVDSSYIAPTSSGYFDVTIDSTGTEVDYTYNLEFAEDIDTKSSYTTNLKASWGDSNSGYIYQLEFNLDYSYYSQPIVYRFNVKQEYYQEYYEQGLWTDGYAWGTIYNGISIKGDGTPYDTETYGTDVVGIPITLTLPEGSTLVTAYNAPSYTYDEETNTVTFIPVYYNWNLTSCTTYTPDWNEKITISEQSDNCLTVLMEIKYTDQLSDDDDYWDSIAANGKTILRKNLADFKITGYRINDGDLIAVDDSTTNITGTVLHKSNITDTVKTKFTFYVEWYDGSDNVTDNAEDVLISKNEDEPYGTIPLKLTVTQVLPSDTTNSTNTTNTT